MLVYILYFILLASTVWCASASFNPFDAVNAVITLLLLIIDGIYCYILFSKTGIRGDIK